MRRRVSSSPPEQQQEEGQEEGTLDEMDDEAGPRESDAQDTNDADAMDDGLEASERDRISDAIANSLVAFHERVEQSIENEQQQQQQQQETMREEEDRPALEASLLASDVEALAAASAERRRDSPNGQQQQQRQADAAYDTIVNDVEASERRRISDVIANSLPVSRQRVAMERSMLENAQHQQQESMGEEEAGTPLEASLLANVEALPPANAERRRDSPNGQQQQQGVGGQVQQLRQRGQPRRIQVRFQRNPSPGNRQSGAVRVNPNQLGEGARIVFSRHAAANGQPRPNPRLARVQLSPLQSQVLPPNQQQLVTADQAAAATPTTANHDRFKCAICLEILRLPVGCGSCASRFCMACMKRLLGNRESAKCPTCRDTFTLQDLQPDDDLAREIQSAATVSCHYQGCNVTNLKLSQVEAHEAACPFVQMRCQYATFGCEWKGPRRDLQQHEETCHLANVSGFVQQFRQFRADQQHSMAHLQQRVQGTVGMMEVNSRLMRRLYPSPSNVFDLVNLVYTAMCTPALLLLQRDVWRQMNSTMEAKARVANFLFLLPTFVHVAKIGGSGFRRLLNLGTVANVDEYLDEMEYILIAVTAVLGGILLGVCCFLDQTSAVTWSTFPFKYGRQDRSLGELALLAFCGLHILARWHSGDTFKYILEWQMIQTASCFFPSYIFACLLQTGRPPASVVTEFGRADAIVSLGLKYAPVIALYGPLACWNAFVALRLLQLSSPSMEARLIRWKVITNRKEMLLHDIPINALKFWLSAWLSYTTLRWIETGNDTTAVAFILSSLLLAFNNLAITFLIKVGCKMSKKVYNNARAELLPNQAGVRREFSGIGITLFGIWVALLGGIALTY